MKRKGKKMQNGMVLPEGLTSSKPTTLYKIMKILKENGELSKDAMLSRMKLRWKYYPDAKKLVAILHKRNDVFTWKLDRKIKIYNLLEEWRNAMD